MSGSMPPNGAQQNQWSPTMQNADNNRADSPQDHTNQLSPNAQMQNNAQRMSLSMPAPKSRNSSAASPRTQTAQPTSSRRPSIDNSNPLTTTLPIETQQLLDGNPSFANQVFPSQFTPGVPMPSTYSYTYNPNSKANNNPGSEQFAFTNKGLNQTLSPHAMHNQPTTPYSESNSASAMPAMDFGFGDDMFNDSSYAFDLDFNSGGQHSGTGHLSGHVTPGSAWNPDDFLNYTGASE
jgi:hypothetical protein